MFCYGFHTLIAISSTASTFIVATKNESLVGQTRAKASFVFHFQVRRFLVLVVPQHHVFRSSNVLA